ncbi:MAG: PEP-utilizing enzyme [Candidatus Nanoarchaeia archaeon]|nr:PEP-utilizing enzyme [Candidatus Nanoarchaeia archaeon]
MNKKQIIQKIKRIDWYRQGGAIVPFYVSTPYRAAFEIYDGFVFFVKENSYGYFDRNKEKKIVYALIKKQIKNKNFIFEGLLDPWRDYSKDLVEFVKKITIKYLASLAEKEFLKVHEKFNDIRLRPWRLGILIESFDPWGGQIIKEALGKIKVSDEDLAVLVSPSKLTFIQREYLDRLKLVDKFKSKKNIEADLEEHVKKYYWIHGSWAELSNLDTNFFLDLIEKDSKTDFNRKINELENYEKNIEDKKKRLIKKYKLSEKAKNVLYFFSVMADWRDERKGQALRINHISDLFLDKLVERTRIDKEVLKFVEVYEVKSFDYLKKNKKEIEKRLDGGLYYTFGKKGIRWFTGKDALELHALLSESLVNSEGLKGVVANKGKVKGKVKIIIMKEDFNKMEKGDIIVTQMTRPEFMPILAKASGIITEEGGLTCHAAVVARELNIPCILATQVATSVLKDNDIVELDANKGVVKILKKK